MKFYNNNDEAVGVRLAIAIAVGGLIIGMLIVILIK